MSEENKAFSDVAEENIFNNEIVSDLNKTDHFLIVVIGILPFIIATILHSILF